MGNSIQMCGIRERANSRRFNVDMYSKCHNQVHAFSMSFIGDLDAQALHQSTS